MGDRLLEVAACLSDHTWVEWPGDWAALYDPEGKLLWQGHPGDFEWSYHLNMKSMFDDEVPELTVRGRAPEVLNG